MTKLTVNSCIALCNFDERSQHFIGPDDEALSITVRVHNPDRLPFTVQAESGIMEIVGDVFQYLTAIAFY